MTTLRVLLHIAAQHDYDLHSLDFSTAFLQGSLHEQIWLCRLPGFTGSFPTGTQWQLRRPAYGLRQAPRRPTCTDLGELQLGQGSSHHYADAVAYDKPFDSSGPYPELVGCLMYLMTCTRLDLAYPLSVLAGFVAPGRHRPSHWYATKRVAKYVASTSGMGLVLGGRQPVTLTGLSDSSWADDAESLKSTQGYCFSLGTGAVSWRSTWASSVSISSCEAEVYAAAMAAQELRWLTFLLTDLGERPRSPPVLTDNRSAVLLCEEPRLVGKAVRD
ncbi:unnamed protein product [Closterium sp. NIES-53]